MTDIGQKALLTGDIRLLLIPYFSFRLYVVFKPPQRSKRHFYGNEHQVTYQQVLYQKVPHILLRKKKGYDDLDNLVKRDLKGRYTSAAIYMRSPETNQFDILCKRWYKGELEEHFIPEISEDECRILYYYLKGGRVNISEVDPLKEDFTIK